MMKNRIVILLTLLLCGIQTAQAWTVELTEDELQAKINRILPIEKKKLLFTVLVWAIDVELKDGSERVGLISSMEIKSPHFSTGKGTAYVDGKLSYQAADGAFYFHEAEVREVKFENIPDKYHSLLKTIFAAAVQRRLAETPIYKLKENKTKHQIAKTLLKSVKVVDKKLVLELGLF